MYRFLSSFLAACFLLMSTAASFSADYEGFTTVETTLSSAAKAPVSDIEITPLQNDYDTAFALGEIKDECPCKKKNGPFTFVCGVSMALSSDFDFLYSPSVSKTVFIRSSNDLESGLQDQLKRPPRTFL